VTYITKNPNNTKIKFSISRHKLEVLVVLLPYSFLPFFTIILYRTVSGFSIKKGTKMLMDFK